MALSILIVTAALSFSQQTRRKKKKERGKVNCRESIWSIKEKGNRSQSETCKSRSLASELFSKDDQKTNWLYGDLLAHSENFY